MNVQFNMLNFFEDNENVYIVDGSSEDSNFFYDDIEYPSIAFFEDIIFELESEYQTEELTWEEALLKLPDPFYSWLYTNVPDLENIFNEDIHVLFGLYLNSFIQDSVLTWYRLPVIYHKNTFTNFWDAIDKDGIDHALVLYKSDINWISILSRKSLSDQTILNIVAKHLMLNAGDYDVTDAGYYLKYPVRPIQNFVQLLNLPSTDYYLRVMPDVQVSESKVYLKGIHVRNESITLPYAIAGIDIERASVNICSGNYDTDVARSSFDTLSRKRLESKVAKLIYGDIMQSLDLDSFEKALIERFLDTYYK